MLITRKSILSGDVTERSIDVDPERFNKWVMADPSDRPFIQDVFPELSEDDREFILTGITRDEWDDAFPEEQPSPHPFTDDEWDDDVPF